jgi:hypothetical protein
VAAARRWFELPRRGPARAGGRQPGHVEDWRWLLIIAHERRRRALAPPKRGDKGQCYVVGDTEMGQELWFSGTILNSPVQAGRRRASQSDAPCASAPGLQLCAGVALDPPSSGAGGTTSTSSASCARLARPFALSCAGVGGVQICRRALTCAHAHVASMAGGKLAVPWRPDFRFWTGAVAASAAAILRQGGSTPFPASKLPHLLRARPPRFLALRAAHNVPLWR